MSLVWRCRVCEAVNQGGRTCATCGTVVPLGEPVRAAVRTRLPADTPPAVKPVPPTPRRRELRSLPPPEVMEISSFEDLGEDFEIVPVPGGCLITSTPRRRRRY